MWRLGAGFRGVWGRGWKGFLEQTCRWSGKIAARLFFDEVRKIAVCLSELLIGLIPIRARDMFFVGGIPGVGVFI